MNRSNSLFLSGYVEHEWNEETDFTGEVENELDSAGEYSEGFISFYQVTGLED